MDSPSGPGGGEAPPGLDFRAPRLREKEFPLFSGHPACGFVVAALGQAPARFCQPPKEGHQPWPQEPRHVPQTPLTTAGRLPRKGPAFCAQRTAHPPPALTEGLVCSKGGTCTLIWVSSKEGTGGPCISAPMAVSSRLGPCSQEVGPCWPPSPGPLEGGGPVCCR